LTWRARAAQGVTAGKDAGVMAGKDDGVMAGKDASQRRLAKMMA
jgi:hypothetical protein